MTALDGHAALVADLPADVSALVATVQGLLVHEHLAADLYGVELTADRKSESHIRPVSVMLDRLAPDGAPLSEARPPNERLVGTCRDFTVMLVALLRAKGVPARARCGFGRYFVEGLGEDHWVAEHWDREEGRWLRVDAQIDEAQRGLFPIDFDLLDVPSDRFAVAGDAWAWSREGDADAATFGLSSIGESGYWFIASNVVRDTAALNNVEMLPWDDWGAMPAPDKALDDEEVAFFDRLAAFTHAPDAHFEELRTLYRDDDRARVPETVYNAVLKKREDAVVV
jgi:Transglutaminase-like superfamily